MYNLYLIENKITGVHYYYISRLSAERAFHHIVKKSRQTKGEFGESVRLYGEEVFFITAVIQNVEGNEVTVALQHRLSNDKGSISLSSTSEAKRENKKIDWEHIRELFDGGMGIMDIRRETGHDDKLISDILKSTGVSDEDIENRRRTVLSKAVIQYDPDTLEVIRRFSSCIEAENEMGYSKSSVSRYCSGKRIPKDGYGYAYENEWREMLEKSN